MMCPGGDLDGLGMSYEYKYDSNSIRSSLLIAATFSKF